MNESLSIAIPLIWTAVFYGWFDTSKADVKSARRIFYFLCASLGALVLLMTLFFMLEDVFGGIVFIAGVYGLIMLYSREVEAEEECKSRRGRRER